MNGRKARELRRASVRFVDHKVSKPTSDEYRAAYKAFKRLYQDGRVVK